jgi:hypothetical protein
MSLFGNRGEKAARAAAAQAEVQRLRSLAPAALAAELMAVFARGSSSGLNELQIGMALLSDVKGSASQVGELRDAVRAGLRTLETAGLLGRVQARGGGWLKMTELGGEAVAAGTVSEALA